MAAEILGAKIGVIPQTEYKEIPNLSKAASVLFVCLMELDNNNSLMERKETGHPMFSFDVQNPESVKMPRVLTGIALGLLNCFICNP